MYMCTGTGYTYIQVLFPDNVWYDVHVYSSGRKNNATCILMLLSWVKQLEPFWC
jgi:hypothetical protein